MPKSKTRRKTHSAAATPLPFGGGGKDTGVRRLNLLFIAAGILAVLGAGYWWWSSQAAQSQFEALVPQGQAVLQTVETQPDHGRTHLNPGQAYSYGTPYPTSGPHDPVWTRAGFYTEPQRPTQIVHALEHGNIVFYYDKPGDQALEDLKVLAGLFTGQWDGIVVVPSPGLGKAVVMTAWRKFLRMETYDQAAVAAFVDAFRGRGPENPVR